MKMKLLATIKAALFPSYRVKIQGRAGIRYREGRNEMMIDSEMLFGKFDLVVYLGTISKWLPPHDHVPVTIEDKERIRQNLARSLRSLSIDWDTSWSPPEANHTVQRTSATPPSLT